MAMTTRFCDETSEEVMSLVQNVMEKHIFQ